LLDQIGEHGLGTGGNSCNGHVLALRFRLYTKICFCV
jgi:hypothetical protein